jgi:hypothetical protein
MTFNQKLEAFSIVAGSLMLALLPAFLLIFV